jgi:hypothetical protein
LPTSGPPLAARSLGRGRLCIRRYPENAGGKIKSFFYIRKPTPLDQQTVVRTNLDKLYAGAIVDTAGRLSHARDAREHLVPGWKKCIDLGILASKRLQQANQFA